MAVEGSVPAPGAIVPHLIVRDAGAALAFYQQAFSAELLFRSPAPSGVGEHLHVRIANSLVQIATEEPRTRPQQVDGAVLASPETIGSSTCVFQIGVDDIDSVFKRAIDGGATAMLPPTAMFWGDRYSLVRDPFGHSWAFSQVDEILTAQDVLARVRRFALHTEGTDK